jgi:5-methylcytosine-specific restriction enzyme subunit McrC
LTKIPPFSEYEDSIPVKLTEEDLKFLRETIKKNEKDSKINIRPTENKGEFILHATSYVGIIKIPSHTITIKPKIGNLNFWKMLSYSEKLIDLPLFEREVEIEEGEDLVDFMAKLFCESIIPITQEGIYRNYTSVVEEIPTIRGKLLLVQNIRNPRISQEKFVCEYDEFSADILENQILLYCSQLLSELIGDKKIKEKLVQIQQFLQKEGVSEKILDTYHLDQITYQKFNEQYEKILKLCEFILRITWYGDFSNEEKIPINGFLYNMNTLFQNFVTKAIEKIFNEYKVDWKTREQILENIPIVPDGIPTKTIEPGILKPDIVIRNKKDIPKLIIDTKYKDHDPPAPDYYQSLAYALTMDCPVLLLLPKFDDRRKEDFKLIPEFDKKVLISVRTIDLSEQPEETEYIELIKKRLEEIVKPILESHS